MVESIFMKCGTCIRNNLLNFVSQSKFLPDPLFLFLFCFNILVKCSTVTTQKESVSYTNDRSYGFKLKLISNAYYTYHPIILSEKRRIPMARSISEFFVISCVGYGPYWMFSYYYFFSVVSGNDDRVPTDVVKSTSEFSVKVFQTSPSSAVRIMKTSMRQ